jgi:hypothetical protein
MRTPTRTGSNCCFRSILVLLLLVGVPALAFVQSAATGTHPYALQPALSHSVGRAAAGGSLDTILLLIATPEPNEAALQFGHYVPPTQYPQTNYPITLISLPPPTPT